MPRVLNYHFDGFPEDAINIMRGTPWGNPFRVEDFSRDVAIDMFERYVLPQLDVSKLRGKDLVCCCKPKRCHGDSILKKANS